MRSRRSRIRGTGERGALVQAIERIACECGRTLLVLDTRQGDTAEQLYRKLGYQEVGVIPDYALSAIGTLDSTVVSYKTLTPA